MAQYKVPQDVEADDKLLGPFSFRQFVYLLIAGGLIALTVGLFQLFPLLAIIPIPFIIFFGALALPLKKDQPMETYLAAVLSYYMKPHNRVWTPGQREHTIEIVAPKVVDDENRARSISGEEATHRLSFLAEVVDSGGRSIDGGGVSISQVNPDLVMEANMANDMFETGHFERLEGTINRDESARHATVMEEMRRAIVAAEEAEMTDRLSGGMARVENFRNTLEDTREAPEITTSPIETESSMGAVTEMMPGNTEISENVVADSISGDINESNRFETSEENGNYEDNGMSEKAKKNKNTVQPEAESSIIELANNADFSVATIAKEAKRIKEKKEDEVFISLH